jgi:hypothetical protein
VTDDAEDDGLKSLRSVWLSMPDEDPPERGLADLMAAARVKATEMARPSLWQRFVDTMRRPPVLALASVMVLIGGAALVGNRSKGMDAQPTVSAPAGPAAANQEALDEGGATSAGSAAANQMSPSTTVAPDVVGGAAPAAEPMPEETTPARPPMKRPAPTAKVPSTGAAGTSATTSPKSTATFERARDDADSLPTDPVEEVERKEDREDKVQTKSATTPSGTGATANGAALSATGPSPTDLHQLARKMVARGDCKAAATLTNRIAKQDPAYYKAKVVPDKTFDRCVLAQ